MSDELTRKILSSLKGCLGITVTHPTRPFARLRVTGWTDDPVNFGWDGMPPSMRVAGRPVYICRAEDTAEAVWVFADEVRVVDAPADMVVDALMEILWQVNPHTADRIVRGEDGEVDEEDDDQS
jgi:hypothetical protein